MSSGSSHTSPQHVLLVLLVLVVLLTGVAVFGCGEPPERETDEVVDAMERELHQLRLEASALQEENARLNEQLLLGQKNLGNWKELERVGNVKGMSPFARFCPTGLALAGFNGQAGAVIDGLMPICAPLDAGENPTPKPIQIELPPAGPSAGGDHFERRCNPGDLVVALRGHAGENVSSVEIICGRYREKAKQYPLPVVGGTGGASYYRRCPKGYALAGISGRADEFVSSMVPLCAPLPVKSVHTTGERGTLRSPRLPTPARSVQKPMERAMVPDKGKAGKEAPGAKSDAPGDTETTEPGKSDDEDPSATKENKKELSPR